jgi:hypothetical protein
MHAGVNRLRLLFADADEQATAAAVAQGLTPTWLQEWGLRIIMLQLCHTSLQADVAQRYRSLISSACTVIREVGGVGVLNSFNAGVTAPF